MELVRPAAEYWPSMASALSAGWSPNNLRPEAAAETLDRGRTDLAGFIAGLEDRNGREPPVALGDGALPHLRWFQRWLWDGEFCGVISLRWQPGTDELPPNVLGHVGFAVVPWKRGRGYATEALGTMLTEARGIGLRRVQLTCDKTNGPSQRTIMRHGGVLTEEFLQPRFGPHPKLRYVIELRPTPTPP